MIMRAKILSIAKHTRAAIQVARRFSAVTRMQRGLDASIMCRSAPVPRAKDAVHRRAGQASNKVAVTRQNPESVARSRGLSYHLHGGLGSGLLLGLEFRHFSGMISRVDNGIFSEGWDILRGLA
jgi:hypothetical protein